MNTRRRLGVSPGSGRIVRTDDRNLVDRRLQARVPVVIEVRLVGLPRRLEEQRRFFRERDAEGVRPGADGHAHLQVAVERLVRR